MAKKSTKSTQTTKKALPKSQATKTRVISKQKPQRSTPRAKRSTGTKVDYYPNRVAFLTAVTAVVLMLSFALAAVLLL